MGTLVLTVIGDDRPGLVAAVSGVLSEHGASWERSQMARLAGQFAGIVLVDAPDDAVDPLLADLRALHGLQVTAQVTARPASREVDDALHLELLGADRPGIVAEISKLLATRGVGIDELETAVEDAPMAGGSLFRARARLTVPEGIDVDEVRVALESLADELMVDIGLTGD